MAKQKSKSFTLIEILVAIGIFLIILVAVTGSIVTIYRANAYTWQQAVAIDDARRGILLMVKEVREAIGADDGSYLIEEAGDKQLIFYSDIDNDNKVERVRYFLGTVNSGSETRECFTTTQGGSCSVNFSNFLQGNLKSAQIRVSVEGDLDQNDEYVDISADGNDLGSLCINGCTHCVGSWQGAMVYDMTPYASDNTIQFTADASSRVHPQCNWQNPNHAMKARFELSWTEEIIGLGNELKKGVIKPTSPPVTYPQGQEALSIITPYLRNDPPIFEYFDGSGNKIIDIPARLIDTKVIKVFLVVDLDPNKLPNPFEIESYVYPRNLNTQ